MAIDPLLSLSMSIHAQKGVYALLLGSGISRAANIPTGWDIVRDLIERLAMMRGEDCSANPEKWYTDEYGESPDYSNLLAQVAKTPAERRDLLQRYFVPTPQERERGEKLPTRAHHAIARLVRDGYIRVIITTNFDRLLEHALFEVGVNPVVLSRASAVEGAIPLVHSQCTILKIHGDYLDPDIKNSVAELSTYTPVVDRLLDRIFDDYGLLICGWSGDWDIALRDAIERCPSRRYSTYWVTRSAPSPAAESVIDQRAGTVLRVTDADTLFTELAERITALERIDAPHPLTPKIAVERLKRYLPDPSQRISATNLVQNEVEQLLAQLTPTAFPINDSATKSVRPTEALVVERLGQYTALTQTVAKLVAHGCYWGDPVYHSLWRRNLERLARQPMPNGYSVWIELSLFPALLSLYAGGIAAFAAERYDTLHTLFIDAQAKDSQLRPVPFVRGVNSLAVLENAGGFPLPDVTPRHKTPESAYLEAVVRPLIQDLLPDDSEYLTLFDRFEYFLCLVYADYGLQRNLGGASPVGNFAWRGIRSDSTPSMVFEQQLTKFGENWPPLLAGFFGGQVERVRAAKEQVDAQAARLAF